MSRTSNAIDILILPNVGKSYLRLYMPFIISSWCPKSRKSRGFHYEVLIFKSSNMTYQHSMNSKYRLHRWFVTYLAFLGQTFPDLCKFFASFFWQIFASFVKQKDLRARIFMNDEQISPRNSKSSQKRKWHLGVKIADTPIQRQIVSVSLSMKRRPKFLMTLKTL